MWQASGTKLLEVAQGSWKVASLGMNMLETQPCFTVDLLWGTTEAFEFHIKGHFMPMARNLGRHLVPQIWDHGKKFQASGFTNLSSQMTAVFFCGPNCFSFESKVLNFCMWDILPSMVPWFVAGRQYCLPARRIQDGDVCWWMCFLQLDRMHYLYNIPLAIPTLKWGGRAPKSWQFYAHQNCSKMVYHIRLLNHILHFRVVTFEEKNMHHSNPRVRF